MIGVGATFDGNYPVPQPAAWWSVVTGGAIPAQCQDDAAHNPNGITADSITCFSSSDALVDLVTPGVYITTTVNPLLRYPADCPGCDYGTYSGTSFASPAAEAIAALLFSARPLGGSEVEKFMKESGTWVTDPKNGLQFRRVNAMNAASTVLTQGVRGDANGDGQVTSADVFYLINNLYSGGPPPVSHLGGNANCDSGITVGDIFYLINFLYSGGPSPDQAPACGGGL